MMKEFSKPQYKVDVLKVEVPVNMNFVEGFAPAETAYTKRGSGELFLRTKVKPLIYHSSF